MRLLIKDYKKLQYPVRLQIVKENLREYRIIKCRLI